MRVLLFCLLALTAACGESEQRQPIFLPDLGPIDRGGLDGGRSDGSLAVDANVQDLAQIRDTESDVNIEEYDSRLVDVLDSTDSSSGNYVPNYNQVGLSRVGLTTYLSWIAEDGSVLSRSIDENGEWISTERVLSVGPADQLTSYSVNGVAWVAWSFNRGPISLTQANVEDSFEYMLEIVGSPILGQTDSTELLVMGLNSEGNLGWQKLNPDFPQEMQEDPFFDETNLPMPDSLTAITGGALMRFSLSGQCIQLNEDALPIGNLPCRLVEGKLISDREMPVLVHSLIENDVERFAVSPVFNESTEFQVLSVDNPNWKNFPNDGFYRVVIGRSLRLDETQGLIRMAFIGSQDLFYSDTFPMWPFPNSRAATRYANQGYVFSFGTENDPRVDTISLSSQRFDGEAYGFNPLGCTQPSAERCDEYDHDCDGRSKDGFCCNNPSVGLDVEIDLEEGESISKIHIGDYFENINRRILAAKVGSSKWVAWIIGNTPEDRETIQPVRLGRCINGESFGCFAGGVCEYRENVNEFHCVNGNSSYKLPEFEITEIEEMKHFMIMKSSHYAIIGRDVNGSNKTWWWYYRDDRATPETALNRDDIIPCDEVLEAEQMLYIGKGQKTGMHSVLIVCADKMVRMYSDAGAPPTIYSFNPLGIETAEWARITRTSIQSIKVLIGHRGSDDQMRVSQYTFVSGAEDFIGDRLSTQLASLSPEDLIDPIQLHVLPIGPPLQIHNNNARVLVSREDNNEAVWLDVITHSSANQVKYNAETETLVTGSPQESGGFNFWVLKVPSRRQDLNLWNARPSLTIDEGTLWGMNSVDYPDPLVVLSPLEDNRWRVQTYGFECQEP